MKNFLAALRASRLGKKSKPVEKKESVKVDESLKTERADSIAQAILKKNKFPGRPLNETNDSIKVEEEDIAEEMREIERRLAEEEDVPFENLFKESEDEKKQEVKPKIDLVKKIKNGQS